MSHRRPSGQRQRVVPAAVAAAALLAAGMSSATAGPDGAATASSQPGPAGLASAWAHGTGTAPGPTGGAADTCPAPFPLVELVDGMEVTGLTVEQGTEPDEFEGSVVGVIDDGIAPDVDMIIVELESPAIERAGGIWSGMSGSPVYADGGRLVGAVAYGLSQSPSSIAGLTPAEDMHRLLDRADDASEPHDGTTALPADIRQQLVDSGSLPPGDTAAGMSRLALPMAVSGIGSSRLEEFSSRVSEHGLDVRAYPGGSVGADAVGSVDDILPGGNLAAAVSYGDVTSAAIGTTTAVCAGNQALGFGHPFLWTGPSSASAHPASAVFVQRDDVLGSYKVANPEGVVGTVDQDRQAGVRARLGAGPSSVPIMSTVTADDVGSRSGTTRVTMPQLIADSSTFHLWANFDRVLDRIGPGTADLRWVIEGVRASGEPFAVDVENKYADQSDIAFESSFDSYEQLWTLHENELEDVQVTSVEYTVDVSSEFTRLSVSSVQVRQPDGSFEPQPEDEPLTVVAGSELELRISLTPYRDAGTERTVEFLLEVPDAAGSYGWLDVAGGSSDTEEETDEEPQASATAADFDQLLDDMRNLVPNNSLSASLTLEDSGVEAGEPAREVVDEVVTGTRSFPVEIVE